MLTLKQLLEHFIAHRKDVITRRTRYDLRKAEERAHLLEGYRIALDNIDEVIEIVRGSQTTDEAKTRLSERFQPLRGAGASDRRHAPAHARRARAPEDRGRIRRADQDDRRTARHSEQPAPHRRQIVKSETLDLKKRFGDERRTRRAAGRRRDLDRSSSSPNIDVVVTYTVGGYIKRVSVDTFRTQNRGGRGVTGISNLKREDVVRNFFMTKTHDHVLVLHEQGPRLSSARLRDSRHDAPSARHGARQSAHAAAGRRRHGRLPDRQVRGREVPGDGHASSGVIKKTKLEEFANVRRNGLNAINLDEGDELLAVDLSDGSRDIILALDARHGGALQREGRAPDGPQRARRESDDAGEGRHRSSRWTSSKTSAAKCCSLRRRRSASARRSTTTAIPRAAARASRRSRSEREDIGQVVDQIHGRARRRGADDHVAATR